MNNEALGHRVAWLGRENGLTLMEMILTAAIIGAVTYAAVRLGTSITTFVQRTPARQRAQMEMNACMDTIDRVMSNGKSSTLNIATPPTTPTLQYSSATFQSKDGATYTIYWSNSPANSVHLERTYPGGGTSDTVLATHVTALVFAIAANDPGIVSVTLQMTVPMDSSGSPGSFATISLPTQTVRMVS